MNPGGVFLVVFGVWVGCQILGGQALERMKIVS